MNNQDQGVYGPDQDELYHTSLFLARRYFFMAHRLPNGYGSITKLSGNRTRPWVVRVTIYDETGRGKQTPVAYAKTEEEANIILGKYNNTPWNADRETITLAELYQRWAQYKAPKLGAANRKSLQTAYRHLAKYYGVKYRMLRAYQMQDAIDSCGRGSSTQGAIKALWGHLDKFAYEMDIIDKMYSTLISTQPTPETNREPFTRDQIDALWRISDQPWVDTALIYLYTGFRLRELLGMKTADVDPEEWLMRGGEKTAAGKGRIVPIHERIRPFVAARMDGAYLFERAGKPLNANTYRKIWDDVMALIDVKGKTPHEARHTFETELDNAHANRKCIDLLMGHKSQDVGNRVYNHKTIDQLRETVALLK